MIVLLQAGLRFVLRTWYIGIAIIFLFSITVSAQPDTPLFLKFASSTIAITPDGATILVVNPDSNSVSLVDTSTLTVIDEIKVGVDPRSVAVAADGQVAYVANQSSGDLSVINLSTRLVTLTSPAGIRPSGVVVSPDGKYVAVADLGDDEVRLFNPATLTELVYIQVADRPSGLAFTPDSRRLLVTHLLSGDVTVLTVEPFIAYLPIIGSGSGPKTSPEVFPYENLSSSVIPVLSLPTWLNVAPAPGVVVNANGTRAYLPQTMGNGQGYNTSFDTTVFPKVSVLNLKTNAHQTSEQVSLPEVDRPVGLPWDVALAKEDTELWVVNSASNDVSVINISNPARPTRTANIPVGDNPRGVVIAPDGSKAYVNNTLAGTVSVIDAQTYTVVQVIPVTTIPLPPALLNGKRLFFSSAQPELAKARWISCNTCHIEGEGDGRTWLLNYLGTVPPGEQPIIRRNSTSLLGMVETYPLRWSAEWNESADSEFSVRFEQYGTGMIAGEMNDTRNGPPNQGRSYDLDCLALYLDSLVVPARDNTLTPAEQRGKAIFESPQTQCTSCHPAPLYTDLRVHDVGTADGPSEWFGPLIDTPTLRFLYDSAPYLHDGSAASLYDVLVTRNPGDEHGKTSHLSPPEIDDLIAFLLALPYSSAASR
jgi:YVTN family beta-propeller protein